MINIFEVTETNKMVEKDNLDVRTITMGITKKLQLLRKTLFLQERALQKNLVFLL